MTEAETTREPRTPAQTSTIQRLCADHRARSYSVERDEPHDGHVFVCLFDAAGDMLGEHVIEQDGTLA